MARSDRFTPPAPPWTAPLAVARLDRDDPDGVTVDLRADDAVRERVARFLDIPRVERMVLTGRLDPASGGGWRFRGQLTATVEQTCVVTLDPVRSVIDVPVRRDYVPGPLPSGPPGEQELDEDDLDAPEPFGDAIDPAQLATEALALALDPWPRKDGAHLPDSDAAAGDPVRESPFARLAALRDRSDGRER